MPYKDPDKQKQSQHKSYLKHKEAVASRRCAYRKRNREVVNEHITPCINCGEDHPAVIDFHHLDPLSKVTTISRAMLDLTTDKLLIELEKCICLCSNCHRLFHAGVLDLPSL